ncbi:hypothetical protein J6590_036714 [Homalodisca vitripennis]|nr:hypothetical protein J6590_036714 [Homalodisca vitripennis]
MNRSKANRTTPQRTRLQLTRGEAGAVSGCKYRGEEGKAALTLISPRSCSNEPIQGEPHHTAADEAPGTFSYLAPHLLLAVNTRRGRSGQWLQVPRRGRQGGFDIDQPKVM